MWSLAEHRQTYKGMEIGGADQKDDEGGGGNTPRAFQVRLLTKAGLRPYPVEGCSGQAATWTAMQVHLWHRNVRDTVVILEKGNLPHPQCPLCDMLVPWRSLRRMRQRTAQFKKGAEWKQRRLAEEEERAVTSRAFGAYGLPLEMVTSFKYLGRLILATDDHCPAVVRNLAKTRAVKRRLTMIIIR